MTLCTTPLPSGVDRAVLEGETDGFVKIHVKTGTDTILGATIVGSGAGDMISEISVAMQHGVGLGKLASVIHPYPTNGMLCTVLSLTLLRG